MCAYEHLILEATAVLNPPPLLLPILCGVPNKVSCRDAKATFDVVAQAHRELASVPCVTERTHTRLCHERHAFNVLTTKCCRVFRISRL